MDLGVGSFVLANAIVSRQARDVSSGWVILLGTPLSFLKSFFIGSPLCKLGLIFTCIASEIG